MTTQELNALADWLAGIPSEPMSFTRTGTKMVVRPDYLLKSDVDWIIAQARTAATSQASEASVETATPAQEVVVWRDVIKQPDERPLPTYGQIPWGQLGRDVNDATFARRIDYEFHEGLYPGHQMVLGINFNSLARIVDKYRYYGLPCEAHPAPAPSGTEALRNNLREAWSALAMIREAVETLGPVGAMQASEHLSGPTFMHEAEAIVAGIRAALSTPATAQQGPTRTLIPVLVPDPNSASGERVEWKATPAQQEIDEIWRSELDEIVGHLGADVIQSCDKDDQIIMDHVKAAHEIAKIVRRKA